MNRGDPALGGVAKGGGCKDHKEIDLHRIPTQDPQVFYDHLDRFACDLKDQPIIHDQIVIAQAMFPGLTRAQLTARSNTIYGLYQSAFGVTVVEADERVRAELASAESAHHLRLAVGSPVLRIERTAYTFDRKPAEWRISVVDTRHFDYVSRQRDIA